MALFVVACGILLMLGGAFSLLLGFDIVMTERGAAMTIGGVVALSGGVISVGIGLALVRLNQLLGALEARAARPQRAGAPDRPVLPLAVEEARPPAVPIEPSIASPSVRPPTLGDSLAPSAAAAGIAGAAVAAGVAGGLGRPQAEEGRPTPRDSALAVDHPPAPSLREELRADAAPSPLAPALAEPMGQQDAPGDEAGRPDFLSPRCSVKTKPLM